VSARWTDRGEGTDIELVLRRRLVRATFAPIVALDTGLTAAFRASIRGPIGSLLENPASLYIAAARRGMLAACDDVCLDSTLDAAARAKLAAPLAVFTHRDAHTPITRRDADFRVVVEFDASAAPAHITADAVARARAHGYAVALRTNDAPDSLPTAADYVIVDIHRADAASLDAVHASSVTIAESLDTEADVERAWQLGVQYGLGLRFGRPDLLVREPLVYDRRGLGAAPSQAPDSNRVNG
jgi:EAL domain-containing protein (putative c-di-GMP-specific phosphodiesterase class I)